MNFEPNPVGALEEVWKYGEAREQNQGVQVVDLLHQEVEVVEGPLH